MVHGAASPSTVWRPVGVAAHLHLAVVEIGGARLVLDVLPTPAKSAIQPGNLTRFRCWRLWLVRPLGPPGGCPLVRLACPPCTLFGDRKPRTALGQAA